MKIEKGMSLIEAVIATAMFFVFLSAITSCLVTGMRAYHSTVGYKSTSPLFRSACIGLDWLGRDLQNCKKIYWPDESSPSLISGYFPGKGANLPFLFAYYSETAGKNKIAAYTINYEVYAMERIIYDPDPAAFNPNNPATWGQGESKILARSVQNLYFKFDAGDSRKKLMEVNLTSYPDKSYFPIKTKINIR